MPTTRLDPYRFKLATRQWYRMQDGAIHGGTNPEPPPPGTWDGGTIRAVSADTLRGSFGVRIFPSYSNKTGGQLVTNTAARRLLTDLSPGMVTHKITPGDNPGVEELVMDLWNNYGIQSVFTVGEPFTTYNDSQWSNMKQQILRMQDALYMVNGQNEVNHVRGGGPLPSTWATTAANHQIRLWNEMNVGTGAVNNQRAAAGKGKIFVGNPNLWSGDDAKHDTDGNVLLPMIRGYVDMPNYHLYPRGGDPNYKLDEYAYFYHRHLEPVAANRINDPSVWELGTFCSEGGYFAAVNYNGGAKVVSQWAHDIYLRKMLLEYVIRGYRWSQFEFLCDPDPTQAEREASFGMLEMDAVTPVSGWRKRPVYERMRAMMALRGGNSNAVQCEISAEGAGTFKHLAVRHSGGTKLFLWRPVDIERDRVQLTLSPAAINVSVRTPGGTQTAALRHDIVELDI